MTRTEYRRAAVKARLHLMHGFPFDADLTSLERLAVAALRTSWQQVDMLDCRLSNFTPDARRRITLYPLKGLA